MPVRFAMGLLLACLVLGAEGRGAELRVAKTAKKGPRNFRTVEAALKAARPGDAVTIEAGEYEESIRLPSGDESGAIRVQGAAGKRVVLSGFHKIAGWKPLANGIFRAEIDWNPLDLYVANSPQTQARLPKSGWWTATAGNKRELTDAADLSSLKPEIGTEIALLHTKIVRYSVSRVSDWDAKTGKLVLADDHGLQAGDRFYLKNRLAWLQQTGEWAVEPTANRHFFVYFKPRDRADLKKVRAPYSSHPVVAVYGVRNVILRGLEIAGTAGNGVDVQRSSRVRIEDCLIHDNRGAGVWARGVQDLTILHSILLHNETGARLMSVQGALVEENEIALNFEDGLVVAGDVSGKYGRPGADPEAVTKNIVVRRNYIHHHQLWEHPDNFQAFRGVSDLQLVDNLLLSGGQGIMIEETGTSQISGNVVLGSASNLVVIGRGSQGWKITGNTFGMPGYAIFYLAATDVQSTANVILGTMGSILEYSGENNIFAPSFFSGNVAPGEKNPLLVEPRLKNYPQTFAAIETNDEKTGPDTFVLRGGTARWHTGDTIEIDWDGIPRQIASVDTRAIHVRPALAGRPTGLFATVANWGAKKDLQLDTRASFDTQCQSVLPKIQLGSGIDIAAYQRGSFDGKSARKLPEIPAEVKAGLPHPSLLPPFNQAPAGSERKG